MNLFNLAGSIYRARFFITRLSLLIFFVLISACHQDNGFNVIIVTFDTTRADHIGVFGKTDANTPTLDSLAKDGVVYQHTLTSIPITLPSHSSIMTGKNPFAHGIRDNGLFNLSDQQLTLAEILKAKGYNTAAAIGSFPLTSQFGINQGFDYFNEHITLNQEDMYGDKTIPKEALFFDERTAAQVNDSIMPWIEENHNDPFFVWFHYFDPHRPHEPPAPYDQQFINDLYQGEIAFADESLGNVIAQLKRLKVYDNSLIIFTSDHGEGNGEHNEETHSFLIYNSTLHVPLIIKYPNQFYANRKIKKWVATVDIFPTILSILNIEIPDDIQGKILPTDNTDTISNEIYAETLSPKLSRGWGELRSIIKNQYKYIYGPKKELYNIDIDPDELNNLVDQKPKLATSMKQALQDYIDENKPEYSTSQSKNMSPKTLDIMRGLGYVQSSGKAVDEISEILDDSGDAPQDHVESVSFQSAVKQLMFKGDYFEASRYVDALLEKSPNNLVYLEYKIQVDIMMGNLDNAKKLLEDLPNDFYGTLTPVKKLETLAYIHILQGNIATAKKIYIEASKIEITKTGQYELAKFAGNEGDFQQQQQHLLNILAIEKNNIQIMNDLAISYALDGDMFKAENTFIEAIKLNPFHHDSYYNYGVFLKSVNDIQAAITHFKKSIEIQPNSLDSYYALIEIYVLLNNSNEAHAAYEKLSRLAPNSKQQKLAEHLINGLNQ
jgi:arylsulfatase A-like enzyme/Tfp pilus assembly protein PilF